MAERLKNILAVANLAAGASVALPHNLHTQNGRPLAPDIIYIPTPNLEVTASTTESVTLKNNGSAPVDGDVLVEAWHTIERAFNDVADEDLPVKPYVVVSVDSALNTPVGHIVVRPGDPQGTHDNVYLTWAEGYAAKELIKNRGLVTIELDSTLAPLHITAGKWDLTNVKLTNRIVGPTIEPLASDFYITAQLDDGCEFTADYTILIEGYGLEFIGNRTGSVVPFDGVDVLFSGTAVRMYVAPGTLPILRSQGISGVVIGGSCTRGHLGNTDAPIPVVDPIVDVNGNGFFISAGAGVVFNNAITDTVGGGFYGMRYFDDALQGSGGQFSTNQFPLLDAAGTAQFTDIAEHRDRHTLFSYEPATPDNSPFGAFLNELVRADSTDGPVVVTAPPAYNNAGNRLTVKDIGGAVGENSITIEPQPGETVEDGTIPNPSGCRTWVADGLSPGTWMLISKV
jgi:hypothetical protein